MFNLLEKSFEITLKNLENFDDERPELDFIRENETKINELRNRLKKQNGVNLEENKYTYPSSVIYMDLVTVSEDIGDYLVNINEALSYQKQELLSGHGH